MAHLPKNRMFRAMNKAGLASEKQIDQIVRKLGRDPRAQREFEKLWREKMGHRFSKTLTAFAGWLVDHWDEIKIALGIVALFLDEEPKQEKQEKQEKPTYIAPPKPGQESESEKWNRMFGPEANKVTNDAILNQMQVDIDASMAEERAAEGYKVLDEILEETNKPIDQ